MLKYYLLILFGVLSLGIVLYEKKYLFKKGENKSLFQSVASMQLYLGIAIGLYGIIMLLINLFDK